MEDERYYRARDGPCESELLKAQFSGPKVVARRENLGAAGDGKPVIQYVQYRTASGLEDVLSNRVRLGFFLLFFLGGRGLP